MNGSNPVMSTGSWTTVPVHSQIVSSQPVHSQLVSSQPVHSQLVSSQPVYVIQQPTTAAPAPTTTTHHYYSYQVPVLTTATAPFAQESYTTPSNICNVQVLPQPASHPHQSTFLVPVNTPINQHVNHTFNHTLNPVLNPVVNSPMVPTISQVNQVTQVSQVPTNHYQVVGSNQIRTDGGRGLSEMACTIPTPSADASLGNATPEPTHASTSELHCRHTDMPPILPSESSQAKTEHSYPQDTTTHLIQQYSPIDHRIPSSDPTDPNTELTEQTGTSSKSRRSPTDTCEREGSDQTRSTPSARSETFFTAASQTTGTSNRAPRTITSSSGGTMVLKPPQDVVHSVLVSRLAKWMDDRWICTTFSKFGQLKGWHIVNGRAYGFVEFYKKEDALAAVNALNGKIPPGWKREIIVVEAKDRHETARVKTRTVYISGFSNYLKVSDLKEICKTFGTIEGAWILQRDLHKDGVGFVKFATVRDASKCCHGLNGWSLTIHGHLSFVLTVRCADIIRHRGKAKENSAK